MTKQVEYCYFSVISPVSFSYGGKRYILKAGDIFKEEKDKADKMMEGLPYEIKGSLRRSRSVSSSQVEENAEPEPKPEPEPEPEPEQQEEDLKPLEEPPALEDSLEVNQETPSENSEQFRILEEMEKDIHWAKVKAFVNDIIESQEPDLELLKATQEKFSHYSSIKDMIQEYLEKNV